MKTEWRVACDAGEANFSALVAQGTVGLTYVLEVQCTTADPSASPLPLLRGAHAFSSRSACQRLHLTTQSLARD